jgi:hypothetical protein
MSGNERTMTAAPEVVLRLDRGGEARVVRAAGDRLALRATHPAAPGTRLAAQLPDGRALRLKILRCVRDGGEFVLETKLFDASRELRRWLAEHG